MTTTNGDLARRWFSEVWNGGDESAIDLLFAQDGVGHGLGDTDADVHGPEAFKPFVRNFRAALPDLHMSIEDLLEQGDKVMVRIVLTGHHDGGGLGVPATGRAVRIEGMVLLRFDKGTIVEGWNSWDQLGLLRQIGALPGAEHKDRFLTAQQ
jgi:steroid delta-isomerase-like uncharacterized protein